MKKLIIIFTLGLFCSWQMAQAQKSITGTVSDIADGSTLPGVSISVKGTKIGTISDNAGTYKITLPANATTLVFSMLGYSPQELIVNNKSIININLTSCVISMDEVIVVGYGTQKKSSLTASVAKLDNKILESGIRANPAQALAGTIPGLRVTTTSGKPGSLPNIVLRGGTNFDGSGSPLIIVDGQFRTSLSEINPEEIESMEVLKDASATAIYGARASNGVILITSKRGKAGKTVITFKSKTGYNYLNSPYEMLSGEDYLYWGRKAIVETYKVNGNQSLLNASGPRGTGNVYKDTNGNIVDGNYDINALFSPMVLTDTNKELLAAGQGWKTMKDAITTNAAGLYDPNGTYKDLLYKEFSYGDNAFRNKALLQDYNIGMSGGNDKGSYYTNVGMYNEDGLALTTSYKRFNFAFNGDYKIKSWLKSESNISYAKANWRDQAQTSDDSYWGRMLSAAPTMRGTNQLGDILLGRNSGDGNPAINADKFIRKNQNDKITMSEYLNFQIKRDLNFKIGAIWMSEEEVKESYNKDYRTGVLSLTNPDAGWNRDRASSSSFNRIIRQTYNAILNYKTTFLGKNNLDAMIGGEYFNVSNQQLSGNGKLSPTDDFEALGLTSTAANDRGLSSSHSQERILSSFARVNYNWDGKYLASFTARRDGFSRLIGDNQYGIFPGASVGWIASNEDFLASTQSWLTLLKLRASWGKNGNIGIGTSNPIGLYELQGGYSTAPRYENKIGFSLGNIPNPNLKWEKTNTVEGAIEYGILKNKITGTLALYNRITSDKIANVLLPNSTGVSSIRTNNGSMKNEGFETEINFKVVQNKDWNVRIGANAAWNKNVILKLPTNGNENNRQGGTQVYDTKSGKLIWVSGLQEGQEPGDQYGFVMDGIIRNNDDLASYNKIDLAAGQVQLNSAAGKPVASQKLIDAKGLTGYWPTGLGDMRWKDIDKNDTIDSRDRVLLGRTTPRWTGGFNISAEWKGLRLFARMDYALGFVQMDFRQMWMLGSMQGEFNGTQLVKDTWTPENPNAKYPIYVNQDQQLKKNYDRNSDMFWVNSSYLAFREVSLSYELPKSLLNKVNITGLAFTLTAQNLGYISNKLLKLPERTGQQDGAYTVPTQIIFSTSLTF